MATLLIDVDGTLIDSYPGIRSSFIATLRAQGMEIPDDAWLQSIPGPPIDHSFARLGLDPTEIRVAKDLYREHYDLSGWLESSLFAHWPETLAQWKEAGLTLCVATSKNQAIATTMLKHFDIAQYFDFIAGAQEYGSRSSKADVIKYVLDSMNLTVGRSNILMIGDRSHDVEGAQQFGIPTVLVSWGYGNSEEWQKAYRVANTMTELKGIVNVFNNSPDFSASDES
ncbi:MAG: HAD-IA family hydrolase [Corynebacterium sp.]|nr:HAD-IA family hydrolase [Corynebacterium sp.]